ncbi:acyltransferase family protein [Sphingosinicella sp. BN140058]|uniref:acyltransferase family protein n=1 Tax=Sphingosinicella sp. BN140058 TaxID=1892855 RepID=UPI0013ED6693|nr:acyltransferase family protein [Sphingosinicella sp. BN140058]
MTKEFAFPRSFGHDPAAAIEREPRAAPSATAHAYRADIDGLRTLAVLPVVFNHIGMRGFGGGYVGVDIFFVISGYLITGILVRDLALGRYSIADFYRRRVLRIFPALFLVLGVTTAIACMAMLPNELIRYAHSLMATTLFGSNILFFSESGYFDAESHVKPLLHTWSLAIEEQFYILWPLLLAAIGVARPARLKAVILAVGLVSLAAAVATMAWNPSAAFYLLPSRAWELALGGGLALITTAPKRRWVNELLGAAGLIGILLCVWKYSAQTPFPGLTALVPCIGAALLIYTGAQNTIVSQLMSLPPVVFIGRISYSLYLWHWPVIVFSKIWLFQAAGPMVMGLEVAASILLAILSWKYVETPFRVQGARWTTRAILSTALGAMAVTIALGGALIASGGLTQRFTPVQAAVARFADLDQEASYRRGSCFISNYRDTFDAATCLKTSGTKPVLLLVGDSHAAHLWPGVAQLRDRYDVVQATLVGCRPMLYPGEGGKVCERFFRDILGRWVPEHRPTAVLLAGRWQLDDVPLLTETLRDPRLAGTKILLAGPVPQYDIALPRLLVSADRAGDPDLVRRFADPNAAAADAALARLSAEPHVTYLSLRQKLCPGGTCRTWASPGIPLQFDYGHLSEPGSRLAVGLIAPDIEAALAGRTGR